jgi:P-type Ca2+ transporter type 2C
VTSEARAPSLRDVADVATTLAADPASGLSASEAAERLRRDGPNRIESARPVPKWKRFVRQFADPLIYLLFAAIAISLVAWVFEGGEGIPYDAVVIAAIVLLNAVLGFVQELRAEEAVAALQGMAAPTAGVLRDGLEQRVATEEVVPGDVLVLAEGDSVSADGRLAEASALSVAEASLTGESAPEDKQVATLEEPVALADRSNMVFSGTAVTRGRGRAIVTATGMDTEMGNVARLIARTKPESTPLQIEINRVGRMLGIAVMAITAVVVATILLTTDIRSASDFVDVLLIGVSLAVAAVPEGLPAILTVVLALGVQRMAKHHAIVKKLSSVETLGSASVVCTDKTGTLTRNEMTIERIVTRSATVEVTGRGYRPEGALVLDGAPLEDRAAVDEVRAVLAGGSLAGDASLFEKDGEWRIQGDPTDAAFLVAEAKLDGLAEEREARFERVGELPFTSERKLMSAFDVDREHDRDVVVFTKGAPDVLLARCAAERVADEERPLSDDRRDEILRDVEGLADDALRPIGVAYRPLDGGDGAAGEEAEHDLVYAGAVGIIDPPRAEVKGAVAEAHDAGIRVMMITGDHPRTGTRIARDLGIVGPGARALTGIELDRLDDEGLHGAVSEVSVYARVSPEHKVWIVDALQADGQVVAMTGDGVNDAPALKSADIGVAMGIAGTDVTREAADMVLADDNFATIIAAVREGRGIFANIRKFLRFLLSSNIGEVATMFFGVVLATVIGLDETGEAIAVPLLATQILWINLLTDSAPALALGVDPPPDDVMDHPPRRMTDHVIDREMWGGILWVGAAMAFAALTALDLGLAGGLVGDTGEIDEARTMAFSTLVFAQLFNCFNARSDRTSAFHRLFTNRLLWGAIALSAALQVAVVELPFMNDAFSTTPLSPGEWLTCIGLASLVLWADELRKLIRRRLDPDG